MLSVAYGSDLHLEFGFKNLIKAIKANTARVLVLAGDIAEIKSINKMHNPQHYNPEMVEFFETINTQFEKVFYVPGNHEFYKSSAHNGHEKLTEMLSQYENITVLQDSGEVFEGHYFHGATMWTDMKAEDFLLKQRMNDFRYIKNKFRDAYGKFSPSQAREIHTNSIRILRQALADNQERKVVLIQHHAPSLESIPEWLRSNNLTGAYYSHTLEAHLRTDEFVKNPNVIIHGHVHFESNYIIETPEGKRTVVLANPRGYIGMESSADNFKLHTVVI